MDMLYKLVRIRIVTNKAEPIRDPTMGIAGAHRFCVGLTA
jgi:hypothetical protein